jgi:hypothetical protein
MMFPDECDNFITKWGPFFQARIIALGKQDYPAVQQLISIKGESKYSHHMHTLIAIP